MNQGLTIEAELHVSCVRSVIELVQKMANSITGEVVIIDGDKESPISWQEAQNADRDMRGVVSYKAVVSLTLNIEGRATSMIMAHVGLCPYIEIDSKVSLGETHLRDRSGTVYNAFKIQTLQHLKEKSAFLAIRGDFSKGHISGTENMHLSDIPGISLDDECITPEFEVMGEPLYFNLRSNQSPAVIAGCECLNCVAFMTGKKYDDTQLGEFKKLGKQVKEMCCDMSAIGESMGGIAHALANGSSYSDIGMFNADIDALIGRLEKVRLNTLTAFYGGICENSLIPARDALTCAMDVAERTNTGYQRISILEEYIRRSEYLNPPRDFELKSDEDAEFSDKRFVPHLVIVDGDN